MMSQYTDASIIIGDDSWFSGSQLFNYINSDDISPLDVQQPLTVYQQTSLNHQPQHQQTSVDCKLGKDYGTPLDLKSPRLDGIPYQIECPLQENYHHDNQLVENNQELVTVYDSSGQYLGPPPVLVSQCEQKVLTIQEHLDYRKALAKERQEQFRAKLDREPLQMPPRVMKKPTGKKMTGRERQQELERQEIEELRRRDRYVDMIANLETKNRRLREILVDIVTKSPDLNRDIIEWLSEDSLFVDSHVNGGSNRL